MTSTIALRRVRHLAFTVTASALVAFVSGCAQPPASTKAPPAAAAQSAVERGKYLVTITGCNDCHTTKKLGPNGPEPDMSRMLAGHPEEMKMPTPARVAADNPWGITTSPTLTAWSGPWGISFAANITPDQNTGIGNWTEEMFIAAIRQGKHMGTSRPILPPMPWQDFANLTDADVKAIYAYLRSIPPITNHVPDPVPPASGNGQ